MSNVPRGGIPHDIYHNEVQVDINAAVTANVNAAVAAATGLRLIGYSARDGASAAAKADIVNGSTGAAAGKVWRINVASGGSDHEWFGPDGIPCPLGISIDFLAGDLDIILHYKIVIVK